MRYQGSCAELVFSLQVVWDRLLTIDPPTPCLVRLASAGIRKVASGSASEAQLACLVNGLLADDLRATVLAATAAAELAKSGSDDRILRRVGAQPL